MTTTREPGIPTREAQALGEAGVTEVTRTVAVSLLAFLLLTCAGVPLVQQLAPAGSFGPGGPAAAASRPFDGSWTLLRGLRAALATLMSRGLLAANREAASRIHDFETGLEKGSFLTHALRPRAQALLVRHLGAGTEQAYPGRAGHLFYRPDVDYATGPGFLDPRVLRRRTRVESTWDDPPAADPFPALTLLRRDLAARGIRLVLLPTPAKTVVMPEAFAARAAAPAHNPSFQEFVRGARAAGARVFDPTAMLVELSLAGQAAYLRTDTHWTPSGVEAVARELASWLRAEVGLPPPGDEPRRGPALQVRHQGDVAAMLGLADTSALYPEEEVTIHPVARPDGSPWEPTEGAPVLLLGDSFTNVFSRAEMGWGSSAGLAEQLSVALGLPVDRIAINAGGSHTTREALARDLRRGQDRLSGTRVVVYQFAVRELSAGDWRVLPLHAARRAPSPADGDEKPATVLSGTVEEVAALPAPGTTPYRDAIVAIHLSGVAAAAGSLEGGPALVYTWGMRDNVATSATRLSRGQEVRLRVEPWDRVGPEIEGVQRFDLVSEALLALDPWWCESVEGP